MSNEVWSPADIVAATQRLKECEEAARIWANIEARQRENERNDKIRRGKEKAAKQAKKEQVRRKKENLKNVIKQQRLAELNETEDRNKWRDMLEINEKIERDINRNTPRNALITDADVYTPIASSSVENHCLVDLSRFPSFPDYVEEGIDKILDDYDVLVPTGLPEVVHLETRIYKKY